MRLLVCGGRNFAKRQEMFDILDEFAATHVVDVVIEGEAPGADSLAKEWAEAKKIPIAKFPADWEMYHKAAGPIRNKQMLVEGKPDLVLAFPDCALSESRGTKNMVTQACAAKVRVDVYELY